MLTKAWRSIEIDKLRHIGDWLRQYAGKRDCCMRDNRQNPARRCHLSGVRWLRCRRAGLLRNAARSEGLSHADEQAVQTPCRA